MNPSHLSTPQLFRILLWVQWRSICARVRGIKRQSPLMLVMLGLFAVGYLGAGYWLMSAGLGYLYRVPLVGSLISQRVIYLIFGFFFVMLVFSNLIIGYSTLFKNREAHWFLSLPIAHRNVYRWKFIESLAISSWALLFLSAPMMAAYGQVHGVDALFYFQVALGAMPFVIIPALLGSWCIILCVRILARAVVKKFALGLAVLLLLLLIFGLKPVSDVDAVATQDIISFERLLRHTRISTHEFLPSAWMAKSVLFWGEGLTRQGTFYFLLLLSNALMGLLIGFEVIGRLYYGSWTISLSSRAERFQRKAEAKRHRGHRRSLLEWFTDLFHIFSQPTSALVLKDIRLFWRDPAQWIQFMIFFGLLCIYVINLRNVALNFNNPFWETLISHLNLTASSLTLSTLTTRFVFPQFSLEGRRLWILGLAPMGLRKVLFQKFWLSGLTATTITVSVMVSSSLMLNLAWSKVAFFAGSVALMSASLSGLAVGLGALFPNFKEDNPSKIVSGFGGTLCLIVSFIYIALFVGLSAVPDLRKVTAFYFPVPDWACSSIPLAFSVCLLVIPLALAGRHVRKMEI